MAISSDTIGGAIVGAYQANAALVASCPYLFQDEVPENDPVTQQPLKLPFARLKVNSEQPQWTFEADYYDLDQITITVFAETAAQADALRDLFTAAFDWASLPWATETTVQVMRTDVRSGDEQHLDGNGNRVFHREIDYQVMVTRG